MGHLAKFRKGWQSEHLAKYIISKFAFIAEPTNISDDLGSDFFCTVFSITSQKELLPLSSFAIQIKSNESKIEITNKLDYFLNLELPFFIGVVSKSENKLTIYSGEFLPLFFSEFGNFPNTQIKPSTYINLTPKRDNNNQYSNSKNKYFINFPKIVDIDINFEYEEKKELISPLLSVISIVQKNISAKKSSEYIFDLIDTKDLRMFAGPGSVTTYQENFYKRLTETFYNIEWRATNRVDFRIEEFEFYEDVYLKLCKLNKELPQYLEITYDRIKKGMKKS
ncbi:MAG TPA: DUF4365 domain-containing protein [Ignavibacteria bacterium]